GASKSSLEPETGNRNRSDELRLTTVQGARGGDGFLAERCVHPLRDEADPALSIGRHVPPLLETHVDAEERWEARRVIGRIGCLRQTRIEGDARASAPVSPEIEGESVVQDVRSIERRDV